MKKKYGSFKLYEKKPNAIKYGYLYTLNVKIPVPYQEKRTVRVYLPEDFDENKKYPVMYMADGQNIVDKYTTMYGEWDVDVRMHQRITKGLKSFIVVGIDCQKHPIRRMQEYIQNNLKVNTNVTEESALIYAKYNPTSFGKTFTNWMVNELKPLIDKTFPTLTDKKYTAVGGASMGGLFAFETVSNYPDIFSFALSFSPAFDLFHKKELHADFNAKKLIPNEHKFFFFCGDRDLDKVLLPGTIGIYNLLSKLKYDDNHIAMIIDSRLGHSERSWSKYYNDAIKFWLD